MLRLPKPAPCKAPQASLGHPASPYRLRAVAPAKSHSYKPATFQKSRRRDRALMNIHEHQAKAVLAEFGAPVPRGFAAFTPDEAVAAAHVVPHGVGDRTLLAPARTAPRAVVLQTTADAVGHTHVGRDVVELAERQVRAFYPIAWFERDGERYRVLEAVVVGRAGVAGTTIDDELTIACNFGALRPTVVQRAGRPAMPTADLLRGRPIPAGTFIC